MVRHGISTVGFLRIFHFQVPHLEFIPFIPEFFLDLKILEADFNLGYIDLGITS